MHLLGILSKLQHTRDVKQFQLPGHDKNALEPTRNVLPLKLFYILSIFIVIVFLARLS